MLGYLFPEYTNKTTSALDATLHYQYWGYADLDVIWGSYQRFAHWFQGQFPFVVSDWFGATGAAAYYINEPWAQELFKLNPRYVPLLTHAAYHNLDEGGLQIDPHLVVDGGAHAIDWVMKKWCQEHGQELNYGKIWQDRCFLDADDSNDWAGPVTWSHGHLRVVKGSRSFPPGRELLFYHRPDPDMRLPADRAVSESLLHDMGEYGFLLPNWVPLMTRFVCKSATRSTLGTFHPYASDCFAKHSAHDLDGDATNTSTATTATALTAS